MKSIQLNYKIPIEIVEQPTSGETGKDTEFLIQGIAINAIVTDNKHKFLAEELDSAAGTLKGVPLLKNHDNMIESIIGRVIDSEFVPAKENIRFKARINDTETGQFVKELVKNGDLNTVSIGADVKSIDEENGMFIPRGIVFKELSLVAVPADSGAKFTFTGNSFDLALREAYNSQSQTDTVSNKLNKQEKEEDMEDEQKKTEPEASEEKEESKEEKVDETSEKFDALSKLVAESIASMNKIGERINKLEEADADEETEEPAEETKEEPKEEPKEETVEEPEEAEEEEGEESVDEKGYNIVQEHRSFSVVRNKY